jgi:hypothetical protein
MKSIFALAIALVTSTVFAQNIDDVVRYSQTNSGGTALSLAMGGATGAVGGDFSSASINPAGLGLFRQSELVISPSIFNFTGNSDYYGTSESDRKFNFNINNFHLVLHSPALNRLKKTGWMGTTIGIGYNKRNNLSERYTFRGVNDSNSIVNAWLSAANGFSPDKLPSDLDRAYNAYLIDPLNDSLKSYTSFLGPKFGGVTQRGTSESRGRIGETNIAFATNYSNRLYLGATLAIRRIIYENTFTYTERDDADTIAGFDNLVYTTTLNDKAISVALNVGAIYRVTDFLRLGVSAFVPLDYSVTSNYTYDVTSSLSNGNHSPGEIAGSYNYKLRQPARLTGSAAFIVGKRGILSVDYETANYARSQIIEDSGVFDATNDAIRSKLSNAGNLRIGGEARFQDMYLRGGFQSLGSPYSNAEKNQGITSYSIGGGYRESEFFIDIAYVYSQQKKNYYAYNPNLANVLPSSISMNRHNVVVSVGTRF